ncbi:MAG: 30S ribosomal protein S21 [Caldisericia bacterium]|jgi:small subunit ribosomal protein S21|nr:30S ribosomal protein S21 [Caldisericia bacterium]MDD5689117.1 30S ribosomal protein S21 [Caldisericia bacterium]HOW02520.1 30S ribosomal protein S21 [Caldisericia bacterium]HPO28837.1 30S ribosomal protein S21 [Caldisericia bacterium]HXK70091.1 30S ribosomal protein S21 [Caldisericia bacterium]
MAEIEKKGNESFDTMLARFKQECAREGIISEIKKHEYYFPPSVKKRRRFSKKIKR